MYDISKTGGKKLATATRDGPRVGIYVDLLGTVHLHYTTFPYK